MDVIWTKEKVGKIISKDSVKLHAHASGDGVAPAPARCCRLCGGDRDLRRLGDTYIWEGCEEKYDQLLYDCFGVRVQTSDCLICAWCVRQLRSTDRFKALVHAAFDRSPSEGSSKTLHEVKDQRSRHQLKMPSLEREPELGRRLGAKEPQEQKRLRLKQAYMKPNPVYRRANMACTVCKQRYPMIVPQEGCQKFVCSRCKQNTDRRSTDCRRCNVVMPSKLPREHLELHAKTDLRGKCKLRSLPKKPLQQPKMADSRKACSSRFLCNLCPRIYTLADHLATHKRTVHGELRKHVCLTCHKDLLTPKLLEDHSKGHCARPIIYQCKKCFKVFSNKCTFQTHLIEHTKR